MAKQSKNNQSPSRRPHPRNSEKRSVSPPLFDDSNTVTELQKLELQIVCRIGGLERVVRSKIELPCSLADMAYKIAEASFSMAEELAFSAKIEFTKQKEIEP